ncbi:response regulator [Azohydromonas aeria]|uniref:response regulator n=1 Tax=Azohydromonas aeria TaxID=2590212 RepID=UPI0012FA3E95|nr:HD domain-containing phosphohydrolase [Azohydromonas aeria]
MSRTAPLLVIDDTAWNRSLLQEVLGPAHALEFAAGLDEARAAAQQRRPALILLDVERPLADGLALCRALQSEPATAGVPVLLLAARCGAGGRAAAFEAGVADCLVKPLSPQALQARVRLQLSLAAPDGASPSYREALALLARGASGQGDAEGRLHPWRMAAYAAALAQAAGWGADDCALLEAAAPLHDIGELEVPGAILNKPLKLDAAEWEIMRTHCSVGHALLSRNGAPLFQLAAAIALNHHEKWDGSSYPGGLTGSAIPEAARIVAVVDAFDALTTPRPYRGAWSVEAAMNTLRLDAGRHFDPRLVTLFEQVLPRIVEIRAQWEPQAQAAPLAWAA